MWVFVIFVLQMELKTKVIEHFHDQIYFILGEEMELKRFEEVEWIYLNNGIEEMN